MRTVATCLAGRQKNAGGRAVGDWKGLVAMGEGRRRKRFEGGLAGVGEGLGVAWVVASVGLHLGVLKPAGGCDYWKSLTQHCTLKRCQKSKTQCSSGC